MILAGDVGGTKTLLGLFEPQATRPAPALTRSYTTTEYASLSEMIGAFMSEARVQPKTMRTAAFGVAGPVLGSRASLTNVPFTIDADDVADRFGVPRVSLLNDLEAMAYAVPVLTGDELRPLQAGTPVAGGNMGLLAAGTGLGAAILHNVNGRFIPSPTEAGHTDWAARTERDVAVLALLVRRYGRAEVEDVVAGRGLPNLHRATHADGCAAGIDPDSPDAPAALTTAALEGRCARCAEALEIFVDAYGAVAGNIALLSMATAGLFIGGGIAPKILPALTDGRFLRAFLDKGAMRGLVERMPVHIILNADAGLLGAAVRAADT